MKKYTNYFITMMCLAIMALINAIILMYHSHPTASAVLFATAFILWFAGIMAPDHEKYKRMTDPNQCDGCRAGLPIKDGIHYQEHGDDWGHTVCTAERYTVEEDDDEPDWEWMREVDQGR